MKESAQRGSVPSPSVTAALLAYVLRQYENDPLYFRPNWFIYIMKKAWKLFASLKHYENFSFYISSLAAIRKKPTNTQTEQKQSYVMRAYVLKSK